MKRIYFFSNGCAAQYKSKLNVEKGRIQKFSLSTNYGNCFLTMMYCT